VDWLEHAPDKLRDGGLVRFHQGTCDRGARFRVLGPRDDGRVDVELFLDDDALLVPGDRFILRQTAPLDTVGGGVVLDIRPPRGKAARDERATLSTSGDGVAAGVVVRLARAGSAGVEIGALAGELGLDREDVGRRLAEAVGDGVAVELAGRWFALARIAEVEAAVEAELGALHRTEPLRPGHSRERLRAATCADMAVDAWRALLERMAARGRVRLDGERLALASHEVVLSPGDQAVLDRIVERFVEGGLEPPDLAEVVREQGGERAERLVELLIDRGRLVRLRDGRPFDASALDGMIGTLAVHARTSKTIDVGTFKDLFGVTRKNAIPLLEYLDDKRVTRRAGNVRQILVD
jgi:selenocysteine-specific elongation factor